MRSRVAVPLLCLMVWMGVLACSDGVSPTDMVDASFSAGGRSAFGFNGNCQWVSHRRGPPDRRRLLRPSDSLECHSHGDDRGGLQRRLRLHRSGGPGPTDRMSDRARASAGTPHSCSHPPPSSAPAPMQPSPPRLVATPLFCWPTSTGPATASTSRSRHR